MWRSFPRRQANISSHAILRTGSTRLSAELLIPARMVADPERPNASQRDIANHVTHLVSCYGDVCDLDAEERGYGSEVRHIDGDRRSCNLTGIPARSSAAGVWGRQVAGFEYELAGMTC